MNLVVLTHSRNTVTRPSTTLEKNSRDLFLPDFVSRLGIVPVLYLGVSRPGRGIQEKFAERYCSGVNFGCLLYPENFIDGSTEGFARACCLDHTSFINGGMFPVESAGMELSVGGRSVYSAGGWDKGIVSDTIAEISRYVFIRTGDLVAVELTEHLHLDMDKDTGVSAIYAGEKLFEFNIRL